MASVNNSTASLPCVILSKLLPAVQDACQTNWLPGVHHSPYVQNLELPPVLSFLLGRYASLLAVSFLVWYVGTSAAAWYRLRQFPAASWLATFSYLWLAKTTYSGRQYWVHREFHRKHKSPLVRIGPNELITDDPEIIRRISAARSGYERDTWYITGRFNPYHDNMFTVLKPKEHTQFKSRTMHAYSGREMPDFEAGIDDQVRTFVDTVQRKYASPAQGGPGQGALLDLGPISCYFTMDVITRLGFGTEFGYLKSETDLYNFLKQVRDLWPQMSTSADVPWIRNVLFSHYFLKLLGPKPRDKEGFGALMGYVYPSLAESPPPPAYPPSHLGPRVLRRPLPCALPSGTFSRHRREITGVRLTHACRVAEHHVSRRFEEGVDTKKKDMLVSRSTSRP